MLLCLYANMFSYQSATVRVCGMSGKRSYEAAIQMIDTERYPDLCGHTFKSWVLNIENVQKIF